MKIFIPFRVPAHLKAAGSAVGIDFTGATNRVPNTILAHVLLDLAGEIGSEAQNLLQEQLFQVKNKTMKC